MTSICNSLDQTSQLPMHTTNVSNLTTCSLPLSRAPKCRVCLLSTTTLPATCSRFTTLIWASRSLIARSTWTWSNPKPRASSTSARCSNNTINTQLTITAMIIIVVVVAITISSRGCLSYSWIWRGRRRRGGRQSWRYWRRAGSGRRRDTGTGGREQTRGRSSRPRGRINSRGREGA